MGDSEKELAKIRKQLTEEIRRRMEAEAKISRFSMDLHDDICPRLAGISMFCKSLIRHENPQSSLAELGGMIDETLARVRNYAHGAFPTELETSLKEALDSLHYRITRGGFNCDLLWSAPESLPLSPAQNLQICRIVEEAVKNAVKHARATRIQIEVRVGEGKLIVAVEDNGSGFKDSGDDSEGGGLGLRFMRYRARQLGATFNFEPSEQGGTRVEIRLPVNLR